jgi:Leu/Phe-tRNA-protein transferase
MMAPNAAKSSQGSVPRPAADGCSRQQHDASPPPPRPLEESEMDTIHAYIPPYLRQFVAPYHGDFCFSPIFDARLVSALMAEGFLPIATEGYLLPKLHERRCIIQLDQGNFHTSKSTRKKSKRYSMTVNQSFRDVVQACHNQHEDSCWLYEPLVCAFEAIHLNHNNIPNVYNAQTRQSEPCPVRLYSIEVWNEQRELVAGELGYTVGSIYTSLTGFCFEDGAGSVQLATLGHLLISHGFTIWDLGMDMEYKRNIGATLFKRSEFVRLVHRLRHEFCNTTLPVNIEPIHCRTMIDATNAQQQT